MADYNRRISMFSVWLFVCACFAMLGNDHVSFSQQLVPAIYILGDSTADVGTNNYLIDCNAKADMLYNGIDYPRSKPTGRFTNGYNVIDYLAQFLGYKQSPPPFLSLLEENKQIPIRRLPTTGVNFASGGSGLLDDTGKLLWGNVVPFGKQVQQFKTVRNNIEEIYGGGGLANISRSLFLISVGSNDIFDLFNADNYPTMETQEDYLTKLMLAYETHLRKLYDFGARKFGIISVAPIGCCPLYRTLSDTGGCLESMNAFANLFYTSLQVLLQSLSLQYYGMMYALGHTYQMTQVILDNPLPFGMVEVRKACCGKGKLNAEVRCDPDANLCQDRGGYLFWDQYHPSEASCEIQAFTLYNGAPVVVFPMSFGQLALAPLLQRVA